MFTKKKLLSILLCAALVFAMAVPASAAGPSAEPTVPSFEEERTEQEEILISLFPEYAEEIQQAAAPAAVQAQNVCSAETEKEVVFSGTREYDEDTQYSLILYSDDTYIAVKTYGLTRATYS